MFKIIDVFANLIKGIVSFFTGIAIDFKSKIQLFLDIYGEDQLKEKKIKKFFKHKKHKVLLNDEL